MMNDLRREYTCPTCGEPVVVEGRTTLYYRSTAKDRIKELEAKLERVKKAIDDNLWRMLGHNHWDSTMSHGAGCEKCKEQSDAKYAISQAIKECCE